MGTRADFYIGRGENAEWLGSIAWDGYPSGVDAKVRRATTEKGYRDAVAAFLDGREDATLPELGWPWPWEDSATTDYAYAFDEEKVWGSCFGDKWWNAARTQPENERPKTAVFPNMGNKSSAPAGSKRSGVILITAPR